MIPKDQEIEAGRKLAEAVRRWLPHDHSSARGAMRTALGAYDAIVNPPIRPVNPSTRDAADS